MDNLARDLAPITEAAWEEIDETARATLKPVLAARRIVDFEGPKGWDSSAIGLGRGRELKRGPHKGVAARLREVQPLVELRAPFSLSRLELDNVARGAKDADLDALAEAARNIALAEDAAVFHGFKDAGIEGIFQAASDVALQIGSDYAAYPATVAQAVGALRMNGVDGPYAIALGPQCYAGLTCTTENGYPVLAHVRQVLEGGPVIWAPGIDGAAVVSLRGGDFEFTSGRDLAVGYESHDAERVHLFIEESFTFRVLAPEAAVPLVYKKGK